MSHANALSNTYFEHKIGANVYPVLPGEHRVIQDPQAAVTTLLGSCVSACLRDKRTGLGGLNHFLLPGNESLKSARYGTYAMEVLINEILSTGCARADLEAKVFGGAAVFAGGMKSNIGQKNALFVCEFLESEGIRVLAKDLGGVRGRRIYYFPRSGDARVQYLTGTESQSAAAVEANLERRLGGEPKSGTVELFG